MKRGSSFRTKFILCLLGVVPVVWVALLIAPYMDDGLPSVLKNLNEITKSPFAITLCENSRKTVLALLLIYVLVLALLFSNERNYRRREEHGSAKWGVAEKLDRKYRSKEPYYNKVLTQNVSIGLNGRKHRRNLNVLICGGSGAGKTRFYCKPNLLNASCSYIVLDPNGQFVLGYIWSLIQPSSLRIKDT